MLNTFNDKEFLTLEADYKTLLSKYSITLRNGRFQKAFRTFREVTEIVDASGDNIIPDSHLEAYRHAMFDLTELRDIYATIKNLEVSEILKDKLKKLNNGSESPSLEASTNTIARDTQFELKLYGDFIDAGVEAQLMEPNPDIQILANERTYALECKRLYSDKDSKVADRISDARSQLIRYLDANKGSLGIIALDISRKLTGGNTYLRSKNEETACARLSYELDMFRKKYSRLITASRIRDPRIVAVLIHASMYCYLEDRELSSHAAQVTVQNTFSDVGSKFLYRRAVGEVFGPLSVKKTGEIEIFQE